MGKIICIVSFLLMACSAFAQKEITGRLIHKQTREALVGANIIIKNPEGKLVKFATTREDGTFFIKLSAWHKGMTLHISMIGMKTYKVPLLEETKHLDISMEEDTKELKEVIVKAGRIRESGDTVTYRVSGFAQKQDRTIGDVLQRMPGIDVTSNGQIKYQGVDINKFYIEGSDLLGGKYGIATHGISHDAIGAVEVMENHQPMQVLSGLSLSDQAAINLKLKDKAKATWLLNGHVGGGWSNKPKEGLWNGEAFLMTVMANYQTITTAKSNNTGLDLRNQVTDFLSRGRGTDLGDYFSVQLPAAPSLSKNRTIFNRSWMLSSSHLWKTRKNEIKAQIDYYHHRATASSASATTYYLDNGERIISESRDGTEHAKQLTGKFTIEANEKSHYLNNTLQTELNWDDIHTGMTGTLPNSQYAKVPDYYVANRLQVIKRFGGNHLVTFTSDNEWESKPQRLSVDYPDENRFLQHISNHAFYTQERVSYGFYLKGFNVSLDGGVNGYLRNMESDFEKMANGNVSGDVTTNYLSLQASPKLEYAFRTIELTLQYPFHYTLYKFNGRIGNQSAYFHSPSLRIRWSPNPRFSITASGGLGRSPMSLQNIHDESILSDYRTFTQGVGDFYIHSRKQVSGRIQYRDTPRGFFAHAILIKSWMDIPYVTTQHFLDDFIYHSYQTSPSGSQSLNLLGNISKTLDFIRGSISLNGGYTRLANRMISENVPTLFHNTSWNVGGRINGCISNFVFWSYHCKYSSTRLSMNQKKMQNLDRYTHSFNIDISPINELSWETGGEYYRNEVAEGNYKDLFLLDTKLTWQVSKHVELAASVTNMLDKKEYTYTLYNNLSSIKSTRYMRGREFMISIYLKK